MPLPGYQIGLLICHRRDQSRTIELHFVNAAGFTSYESRVSDASLSRSASLKLYIFGLVEVGIDVEPPEIR